MGLRKDATLEDMGVYFGYPQCCINEFMGNFRTGAWRNRGTRKLDGTGYIPCVECNKKSVTELKEAIAKHRIHPEPFPKDGE